MCYTEILKKYDMNTIIIKPHPEDKLNYKEIGVRYSTTKDKIEERQID